MAVSGHQDIYGGDEGLRHHLCLHHGEHLDEGASREHMEELHEDEHPYGNGAHRGEYGCHEHNAEDEPTEFHDMHESGGIGEIHRGIGVSLPDRVHRVVHDESRPAHERAQALLGHVSDHPGHLGMHWTTENRVAEDFAERSAQHEANEDQRGRYALNDFSWGHEKAYKDTPLGKPGTAVVFHAHEPSLDAIESDGYRLSNGGGYGWSEHGEREVPIRDTQSLDLKGISWAPMHSDDEVPGHGEYTHHDFGHEHTAAAHPGQDENGAGTYVAPAEGEREMFRRTAAADLLAHFEAADDTSYRMSHQGPDADDGEAMHEVGSGKVYPADIHQHPDWYGVDSETGGWDSWDKVRKSKDWPSRRVTMYRSLPSPHREVNTGDWVTSSAAYAREHGRQGNPDDDWPVVKFEARADQLRTSGDSINEWSYHGPKVNRALVHFSGGKNHRGKGPRGGRADALLHEHEPPEMHEEYSRQNAERRQRIREEKERREQGDQQREAAVQHQGISGESAPEDGHTIWARPREGTSPAAAEVYHNMHTREPEDWYKGISYHGPYHIIRHPETRETHLVDAQGRDANPMGRSFGNWERNGTYGESVAEGHWRGLESVGPDAHRTGTEEDPKFGLMKERTPAFPHSKVDPEDTERLRRPDARVHAPEGYSPDDEYHGSYEVVRHPETGKFHVVDNQGRHAPHDSSWGGHDTQLRAERSRDYTEKRQQSKENARGIANSLWEGFHQVVDPGSTPESRESDRNLQRGQDLMTRYNGGGGQVKFDSDEEGGAPYYEREHHHENGQGSGWYVKHYGGTHADIYHRGTGDETGHDMIWLDREQEPDGTEKLSDTYGDADLARNLKSWHDEDEGTRAHFESKSTAEYDPDARKIQRWKQRHVGTRQQFEVVAHFEDPPEPSPFAGAGQEGGERRSVTAAAEYGPKPEWQRGPEGASDEEQSAHYDRQSKIRHGWEAHVTHGISTGQLTPERAKELGHYFDGHQTDNQGQHKWQPLPEHLYHVTTNLPGVREHGLKTRTELEQQHGGHGLGGGPDDMISLTDDHGTAKDILRAVHEFHHVVNGRYTPAQMWEDAKAGKGAPRPFHEDLASYHQSGWKDGDPLPRHLDAAVRGKDVRGGGLLYSPQEMAEHEGPGWAPHHESSELLGRDGVKRYNVWERDLNPDERREHAADFYKNFAAYRSWAGGHEDPLFFSTDTKAFAAKDPKDFAIVHARPRPGAMGHQVSALGEWRTGTGDALETHRAERLEGGHLKEASVSLASRFHPGLPNPQTGGDDWFHGTKSRPGDFVHGFSHDDSPSHEEEEMRGHLSHWNTLLGSHFAADHGVAEHFARQGASTDDDDDNDWGGDDYGSRYQTGSPQSVIHARLHLRNPKVYGSEFDMDHEAYEHEYGQRKNYISKHFEDGYEHEDPSHEDYDPDTPGDGEEWPLAARYRHDDRQPIGREQMRRRPLFSNPDAPEMPERTGWLNSHPDKAGIARRFRERLQGQGHDGILYGNEFEDSHATGHGNHHGLSAIIFHPHQAEVTQHHQAGTQCLSREEGEHQRGRMPQPGQEELPGAEEHADHFPNGFLRGAALVAHFEEPKTAAGPFMQQKLFHMQPDPTLHEPESGRHNPADPEGHLRWRHEHDEGYEPDTCEQCGEDQRRWREHAEKHDDWQRGQDWYTDWREEHPGAVIHRGIGVALPPEVHSVVHDESRPLAERARALAHHVTSGGGLGNFWSSDPDVSKTYAESSAKRYSSRGEQTPVMLHAHTPETEHIETDPETLQHWGVYSYHLAGNREVPLTHGAPVHLKGISWAPPGHEAQGPHHTSVSWHNPGPHRFDQDPAWTHHEFGGEGIQANASLAAVVAHFEEGPLPEYHGEPLYHGTRSILEPGEHLTVEEAERHPNNADIQTDPYVHATTDPREAHRWGERANPYQAQRRMTEMGRERRIGPGEDADHAYRPRVYEVHPTGHVEPDLEYADTEHDSWRSASPVRVGREVEPLTCYDCPDTGGNEEHWPDHPHYEYLRQQADEDEEDRKERGRTGALAQGEPAPPSFTWKYQTYGPNGGYVDQEREVAGPFYHGSRSKRLQPGSQVKKGMPTNPWGDEGDRSKFVHFTTDLNGAASYARQAGGHVYEVEPTGNVHQGYSGSEWKSEHPLRVLRRVPGEELPPATAAVVAHFEDDGDDEDPDDYSASDEWDEDAPPERDEDKPAEEPVAHRNYRLPYMTRPPEGELIDHLHHHHGLDARTSDLYMNAKDRDRWHASEHQYKTNSTHQHDHPQGAPGEEHWPAVFELSEHTDFPGGTRGDWSRVPGHTAPFRPLRSTESVSLPEVTAVHPGDQHTALPQDGEEMWRHLQEGHGLHGDRTPGAGFMNDLHSRFHGGQTADPRRVPHQHEDQGSHPASGQSTKDYISRMFTPIPPEELEEQRRAREPKPERLDDREYSVKDVSRHYDWEGFSSHDIGHLVHHPERAVFTKEDVPVHTLRHADEHGSLVPPPSYRDIAGQGDDERERLEELERGYDQGDPVPPIVAVRDGEHHIIADGSHRAAIHAERGSTHIPAFVTQRTIYPGEHTAAVTAAYDWNTDEGPFTWDEIARRHPRVYGDDEDHEPGMGEGGGHDIADMAAEMYHDRPSHPYSESTGELHPSSGSPEADIEFHPRTVDVNRIDYMRVDPGEHDPRVERAKRGFQDHRQREKIPPLILVHRHGVYQVADGSHRGNGAAQAGWPSVRAYVAYSPHEDEPFAGRDGEPPQRGPVHGAETRDRPPMLDHSGEPARRISFPGFPHTTERPRPQAHEASRREEVTLIPVYDTAPAIECSPLAQVTAAAELLGAWAPQTREDALAGVSAISTEALAALRQGLLRLAGVIEEMPVHPDVAELIHDMARSVRTASEDSAAMLRRLPPEAPWETPGGSPNR
jgi:hypothetical protein